nr:hypothetical protein Itr_chr08CG03360 [Ipomoea trifida]
MAAVKWTPSQLIYSCGFLQGVEVEGSTAGAAAGFGALRELVLEVVGVDLHEGLPVVGVEDGALREL